MTLLACLVVACGGASGASISTQSQGSLLTIATVTPTVNVHFADTARVASTATPTDVPPEPTEATQPSATPESKRPTATATPGTAVPAPPAPTATIEPTATTAPPQPGGEVQVVGTQDFVTWTNRALAMLQTNAPTWYQQVSHYLIEILQVPTGTGRITVGSRTFQAGPETAHAPTLSETQQLVWYAGAIVHDSCHERLYEAGKQFGGKQGEIACLQDQKAALLLIEPDPFLSNYVQGLIDGADDPANQYWLNPHW
jgi:hypothetical protein